MKILKLKALNINSLKGEIEIDFRTFLNDNALFAITGATGSGKSTILDIITCALYGRTPRLKNPNELMSRHTGECFCEVEFEIKGDVYRSLWSQKRARKSANGKFQSAKMELSDLQTSKVIKSTLRDVPKHIEELSGLDFDRFSQSMMLAQGSFDAFLKAKEADRSSLLEKITGTQIYAKISKEIYNTYSASKSDIETQVKLLEAIELLDSKEVEEKTKALEENKKEKLVSAKLLLVDLTIKVENELKNNDFKSIEVFEKGILRKEEREELSILCKTIENKYNEYQILKINTSKALEEHKKKDIERKPIEDLNKELQELQLKTDELQLSIGALSQTLKRDSEDREKNEIKTLQLEKKKDVFKVWIKLNEMIGSADGNKFAKFAQGITLDQLISLANNHLTVLSSRYELQRSMEQKHLLEIEVIDSYQGNVVRSVNTLSGGESFIVSLALALGLSELASQKIAINSLFLDEGFASLDEESLDIALTALNSLQSSGKMVGIISHVEALKERVPLQIRVISKGDGTSTVEEVR